MSSGKVEVNDFFGDVSDVFFFGHVGDVGMIQGNPLGLKRSETMDTGTLQAIHM